MIAFIVGIVVFIICATITSERKHLIPIKDKTIIKDNSKSAKQVKAKESSASVAKTEPEFKNSTGLNILLYVGCFLIIAALMGYVSTVDEGLIPAIVISITIVALLASILIFKLVKFLKPSSYAFNLSALIMFLFWIPSLEAMNISENYAILASFFFLTGASIISAAIFKHKALWYVPAFSIIGLILFGLDTLDSELELVAQPLLVYGSVSIFALLGIALRYFWKAKVTWLPVQLRHASRTFSVIYPIISSFFALAALDRMQENPFAFTFCTVLLCVYFALDSFINKTESRINVLRVSIEAICIASAIDICGGVVYSASDVVRGNVILATITISSIIQALISTIIFAVKHDEESHARERLVFAAAIAGLAISSFVYDSADLFGDYHASQDLFSSAILITSQLSIIIFSIIAMLLDRNPALLIIAALGLCDLTLVNFSSTPIISCIILSVSAVIFSLCYMPLRKLYERNSLLATIASAVITCFAALYVSAGESISYIPFLAIGLSMAIQGFLLNKGALRITGVYLAALGIVTAWASARTGYITLDTTFRYRTVYNVPDGVRIGDVLMCLVPPAAAFLLSAFDNVKQKTLSDGSTTTTFGANFLIGCILAVFNTVFIMPLVGAEVKFISFTLALVLLVALLIWSAIKRWLGFEITALCAIFLIVLENVGDNMWISLSAAGIIIIGIVIFVSYRNYKKINAKRPAIAKATEAPKAEEPKSKE